MATRNRIIYNVEALFASNHTGAGANGAIGSGDCTHLKRVQSISHSAELTRTDVNAFGKLAALDRPIVEEPTVSMDFSYYATNGYNESGIGLTTFKVNSEETNCISGILANNPEAQKNYYILTVTEGLDADGVVPQDADFGVVGIGNAFLSSYTFNASVGELPTVDVSCEASNIQFGPNSATGFRTPAIDVNAGTAADAQYSGLVLLPPASETGVTMPTALRPGDITLEFGTNTLEMGGALLPGMNGTKQTAHVQSVSLEVPLSRTPQQRLGNPFAFSRELDVPINVTCNVTANLADIDEGSLVSLICNPEEGRQIAIKLSDPCSGDQSIALRFDFKGALLDSQSFDSSIGDNKTVDLTFSAQIGGPNDADNGLFISGRHDS